MKYYLRFVDSHKITIKSLTFMNVQMLLIKDVQLQPSLHAL